MTREAQFEALATMWAGVHQDAQTLCHGLHGNGRDDTQVLAAAHRALLADEDPRGVRTTPADQGLALIR
jgi:hypothetical protein